MVVLSLIHENLKWCANLCWNADLGKNSLLSILLIPPSLPSAFQLVSPSPCSLFSILLITPSLLSALQLVSLSPDWFLSVLLSPPSLFSVL